MLNQILILLVPALAESGCTIGGRAYALVPMTAEGWPLRTQDKRDFLQADGVKLDNGLLAAWCRRSEVISKSVIPWNGCLLVWTRYEYVGLRMNVFILDAGRELAGLPQTGIRLGINDIEVAPDQKPRRDSNHRDTGGVYPAAKNNLRAPGRASAVWRRRAGSNRCIAVLQTAPLTTWVRRLARIIAGLLPISQRTV